MLCSESFIWLCAWNENCLNANIVFTVFSGHARFTLVVEELLTPDLVAAHPNMLSIPDVLVLPGITVGSRCCLRITETPDIFGYRYQCRWDSHNVSLCLAKYLELGELKWKGSSVWRKGDASGTFCCLPYIWSGSSLFSSSLSLLELCKTSGCIWVSQSAARCFLHG